MPITLDPLTLRSQWRETRATRRLITPELVGMYRTLQYAKTREHWGYLRALPDTPEWDALRDRFALDTRKWKDVSSAYGTYANLRRLVSQTRDNLNRATDAQWQSLVDANLAAISKALGRKASVI